MSEFNYEFILIENWMDEIIVKLSRIEQENTRKYSDVKTYLLRDGRYQKEFNLLFEKSIASPKDEDRLFIAMWFTYLHFYKTQEIEMTKINDVIDTRCDLVDLVYGILNYTGYFDYYFEEDYDY
jgi:hypothetical protein